MSYHEGESIDKIDNKMIKYGVSNDINFIILSSIMIHNFLHADLHNGNWKVQVKEDNKYNIIMYDCGLIAHTRSIKMNREMIMSILTADYTTFIKLLDEYYIANKNEPANVKIKKLEDINNYIDYLINDINTIASERFVKLIKYSVINDIIRDQGVMSLLMSIIMTSSIHIIGIDRNQKFFGTSPLKNDIALIFCSYIDWS
jgi:predicted unusual protein kinase regulating ubiquinone biosynthesis (AarF/ABC1/UbiB family)